MTLDALRCFCAVVDTGSFRRAAEQLYRTQPAVSQQIKTLEREFGQQLLDRKSKKPTRVGQAVYDRSRNLLRDADNLEDEVRDLGERIGNELRLGTSDTNALYYLPSYVSEFTRQRPGAKLVIRSGSSAEVAGWVEKGELDVGIVTLPPDSDALESRKLYAQRFVLLLPKGHRLAGRSRVSLQRLEKEQFVLLQSDTRTGARLSAYFHEQGFEPHVVMDSGSFEVIKRYVLDGLGVSFVPETVLTPADRPRFSTVKVAGLPRIEIGAVWPRGVYQREIVRTFLEGLLPAKKPKRLR